MMVIFTLLLGGMTHVQAQTSKAAEKAEKKQERKLPNNKRKNLFTFPVSHLFPIPYYLLHLFAGKSRRDVLQEDVNRITL